MEVWTLPTELPGLGSSNYATNCPFPVPPVCNPRGVKVYGVAKMETAHISCSVEANPPGVNFR